MSNLIPKFFREFLLNPNTLTVLSTPNEDGSAHLVFDSSIHIGEDGRIVYLEFEEFSATNKNLVRSIWFSKRITLQVRTADGREFQIRGLPWKALIGGPLYEKYYNEGQKRSRELGLSTVWLITPESFTEETPAVRAQRDSEGRIPLIHLDRLTRAEA